MPDARPLNEPAKATMQTSIGAGLGTAIKWRSTTMAIRAVVAVNAGPEIARQSKRMPVLVSHESKGRYVTIDCISGYFSGRILKERLIAPVRLSDSLDSTDIGCGWNRRAEITDRALRLSPRCVFTNGRDRVLLAIRSWSPIYPFCTFKRIAHDRFGACGWSQRYRRQ
jgi:hypothetical protein